MDWNKYQVAHLYRRFLLVFLACEVTRSINTLPRWEKVYCMVTPNTLPWRLPKQYPLMLLSQDGERGTLLSEREVFCPRIQQEYKAINDTTLDQESSAFNHWTTVTPLNKNHMHKPELWEELVLLPVDHNSSSKAPPTGCQAVWLHDEDTECQSVGHVSKKKIFNNFIWYYSVNLHGIIDSSMHS